MGRVKNIVTSLCKLKVNLKYLSEYLGKSALHSLPLVIIPVSRYVCVCVCLSFCVNVCCWITKIQNKNHLYRNEHFQSNGANPVSLHIVFDLHFQCQTFGILFDARISRKWREMKQTLLLSSSRKSGICHRMAPLRIV